MADLSITVGQVVYVSGLTKEMVAAQVITQGQTIYKNSSGQAALFDANGTGTTTLLGIALSGAAVAGQKISVQLDGVITLGAGASITAGTPYFGSATAGGICPDADLSTGHYVSYIGTANASNQLVMHIHNSGVSHA